MQKAPVEVADLTDMYLRQTDALDIEVSALEVKIEKSILKNPDARRMQTMPGVGPKSVWRSKHSAQWLKALEKIGTSWLDWASSSGSIPQEAKHDWSRSQNASTRCAKAIGHKRAVCDPRKQAIQHGDDLGAFLL